MFSFLYNFICNFCKPNPLQILPINETTRRDNDLLDIAIERTVFNLLFNKIIRNLKLSVDDFNTIYLLPFDKKMKIIQLINKLMNP
jgi:hypothetical protein